MKLAIAKGRERGIKVHAWIFTMNVGTGYGKGLDRNGLSKISPILVGQWNEPFTNRPSLEVQMQAIRAAVPMITSISHFAFGWQTQEIEFSRSRQICKL